MTTARSRHRSRGLLGIFGIPLVLAILSGVGLIAALLGDGGWHPVSWLTLGAPLAVIMWYARAR